MWPKKESDGFLRSTRLTATVTTSAPDSSSDFFITSFEGYLPEPTIRRDVKVLPPILRVLSVFMRLSSSSHAYYFDSVVFFDYRQSVRCPRHYFFIKLHGNAFRLYAKRYKEFFNRRSV